MKQRTIFPGSFAETRLNAIAKRLGGKVSIRFSGIVVNGHDVLYRHAQYGTQPRPKASYEQWNWRFPFGKNNEVEPGVEFFLLHATRPEEAFFLFDRKAANRLIRIFPLRVHIPVSPKRLSADRAVVLDHRLTLAALKRALK